METLSALAVGLGCFAGLQHLRRPQVIEEIPEKMKRLVLREANKDISLAKIEVEEVDTPKPGPGQVLIKVLAAPVNPSDDGAWRSPPSHGYPLPLGIEGSGRVIATGGSLWAWQFLGREVAFTGKSHAQYAVVDSLGMGPFKLPSTAAVEDACSYFVNPFTVVSMVEAVKSRGGKAFIHTAAASQLGQMLVKYCELEGMTVVNLVRRKEQVELLEKLGAKYIIDTSNPDWKETLKKWIVELHIFQAMDCIAGDNTAELLEMLPPHSTAWVYGRLSGKNLGSINPIHLIYHQKKIEGFMVSNWLFKDGMLRGLLRARKQAAIVGRNFQIFGSQFKDVSLDDMHQSYCSHLATGATGGKIRVRPWKSV